MPGRDPGHAEAVAKALGRQVSRRAGGRLEVSRTEVLPADALDVKVDPKRGAEAAGGPLVVVRGVAQAVVDVKRVEPLGADERRRAPRRRRPSRRRPRP